MSAAGDQCLSFCLLAPGLRVGCTAREDHGPIHIGAVTVTLADGSEHPASLIWEEGGIAIPAPRTA